VPEHFNLPWRQAISSGAFADSGIRVSYTDYPAGTGDLTRALRDEQLDMALVLTEGAVADAVNNNCNQLVKVFVRSPLVWGIHVGASSGIRKIADIRGKRVAISRYGSGSHLIAMVDAAERGWAREEMSFVLVNYLAVARKSLAASESEVFLWERHMTQPLVDSGEFRRVGEREVPWPAFVVSVRRDVLASRSSEIRTALDIVARYASRLKRRKSAVTEIASSYQIQPADAARWLESVRWGNSYRRPVADLQRVAKALEAQAVIEPDAFSLDNVWRII
jgi:hypothetical protein